MPADLQDALIAFTRERKFNRKEGACLPLTRPCRPPQGKDGCVSGNAARGFLRRPNLRCGLFTGPDWASVAGCRE